MRNGRAAALSESDPESRNGLEADGHVGEPQAPAHTDWLRHRLAVSGPAGEVARFRAAACGTGGIPWHLDLDHEEARLLAPMAGQGAAAGPATATGPATAAGAAPAARALARELREAIAARHALVLARWHEAGNCPLDLHRLIPIPDVILTLGEDAPEARHWRWTHWGTTQTLRQVCVLENNADRRLRRSARVVFEFLSADWTPWRAILQLRRDWPKLVFAVEPRYGEAGTGPASACDSERDARGEGPGKAGPGDV